MQIRGLTKSEIWEAFDKANHEYGGNLRLEDIEPLNRRGDAYKVRLKVVSSYRIGARVSHPRIADAKPRRVAAACWHANRDFYREIFEINPDARIRTALAHYKDSGNFELTYWQTAYGWGNQCLADACNCREGAYPELAS